METNVHYTVVGIFVITLIAAITLAIIWLSSGFSFETYKVYAAYMQESVNGLNLDAPVEFNGVNVGQVESIEISKNNPRLVKVLLKVKGSTPITQGTEATLTSRGVTGVAYLALKDKGQDLRPLVKQKGQEYPVIKTVPSLFTRLDAILSQLSDNFKEISKTFRSVFDEQNQQSIKVTLENLKQVTDNLSKNSEKFNIIVNNTARATERMTPFFQSSTTTMRTLETQTLPSIYRVLTNLEEMSRSLADTAQEIKQNPAVVIRGVERNNLGPGERR